MTVPLVMTHGPGGGDYLPWVLKQARQYNERVVLLGEPEHQSLAAKLGVEHHNWAAFYTEARGFFKKEYVQYSDGDLLLPETIHGGYACQRSSQH